MPERDEKRRNFLATHNLVSDCDGLVAKRSGWRSSFSLSERNVISLHPQLYQALKYLNKVGSSLVWLQSICPLSISFVMKKLMKLHAGV